MRGVGLNYANLSGQIAYLGRTESASFFAWFLEDILRLSGRGARRDAEDKFRVALSHVVILVVIAGGYIEPVARVEFEPHLTFRVRHVEIERT